MTAGSEGKVRLEFSIVERARKYYPLFPGGEIRKREKPDFQIDESSLGIEVSQLLPESGPGQRYPGVQIGAFQDLVIQEAENHYLEMAYPKANVTIFLRNDLSGDARSIGRQVAETVRRNYPKDSKTVSLNKLALRRSYPTENEFQESNVIDHLTILPDRHRWRAGHWSNIPTLSYEQMAIAIEGKQKKLSEYRKNLPRYKIWLLLFTRPLVQEDMYSPSELLEWKFKSDFEKVLFVPWSSEPVELRKVSGERHN